MKKLILNINMIFILLILISFSPLKAQSPSPSNNADIVTGFNTFAFDLYNKVNEPAHSAIFSPYSLSSLLGILAAGSAEQTHDELLQVLHLNTNTNAVNLTQELNKINTALTDVGTCKKPENCKNNNFVLANALWADENLTYKKPFLDLMQKQHDINFFRVNFAHAPDKAKDKINSWVSSTTQGYIKNLFDSIPDTTMLVLTNAIYFKGLWHAPFDAKKTQQRTFTLDNGSKKNIPMMMQQDKFLYAENDMVQMLQLRYTQSNLVMAILLPKPNYNLQKILKAMNQDAFSQLLNASDTVEVNVSFPKFKLDSTFDSLSQSLQSLGLISAFGSKANFSNMTEDKLLISDVIQKAVIQVDEKGTVAAAATGMIMATAIAMPTKTVFFKADHPFLFIIFDKQSGLILFMGQVAE